jgi:hypothetical protein
VRESLPIPPLASSLEERRALHTELAREDARRRSEAELHAHQLADATGHVERARECLRVAEVRVGELRRAELTASGTSGLRVERILARLRAGADPRIGALVRELDDLADAVRAQGVETREHLGARNHDGKRPTLISSNLESVASCMAAIRTARTAATALQLEALDTAAITERLEALRASVPEVSGLLVQTLPILTPAEIREAEWRAAEDVRNRWTRGGGRLS